MSLRHSYCYKELCSPHVSNASEHEFKHISFCPLSLLNKSLFNFKVCKLHTDIGYIQLWHSTTNVHTVIIQLNHPNTNGRNQKATQLSISSHYNAQHFMGNNAQLLILSQINRLHGLPVRIGSRESKVELEFHGSQTALKCGVIFVEQIEGDDEKSDGKEEVSRAWGIVVQGQGCGLAPTCYLLKTSKVSSGIGLKCTHFCLVKLKNCWLLQEY
ncbi:hypothetical protein V6Z11_D11G305500 [Gossypium hirsutum]